MVKNKSKYSQYKCGVCRKTTCFPGSCCCEKEESDDDCDDYEEE